MILRNRPNTQTHRPISEPGPLFPALFLIDIMLLVIGLLTLAPVVIVTNSLSTAILLSVITSAALLSSHLINLVILQPLFNLENKKVYLLIAQLVVITTLITSLQLLLNAHYFMATQTLNGVYPYIVAFCWLSLQFNVALGNSLTAWVFPSLSFCLIIFTTGAIAELFTPGHERRIFPHLFSGTQWLFTPTMALFILASIYAIFQHRLQQNQTNNKATCNTPSGHKRVRTTGPVA